MRPLWKGSISFGLVNIPVGLYPATQSMRRVDFHLLRDRDLSRIRYKRVAEADGQEVPLEHIVKGFEYEKDNYVVVTPEDLERVQLKSTQTVDIKMFVDLDEIEPRYFDQPYFLAPEKSGAKAYALLRETLQQSKKAGIAKVVIRPPREHLAAVKPIGNLLGLELLHFADELRDPSELSEPNPKLSNKETEMARSLVETMSGKWDPREFRDEYRDALMQLIEQKIKTKGKGLPTPKRAPKAPSKVIDLVSVLQQSLANVEHGRGKSARKRTAQTHRHKQAA